MPVLFWGFCLNGICFRSSGDSRLSRISHWSFNNKKPLGISGANFLEARCTSCQATNSIRQSKFTLIVF